MPERLDRVTIPLSRETITLSWDTRTALLEQMKHLDSCRPIRDAFDAVGATRPVRLTHEQKSTLITVIEHWGSQVRGGLVDGLPEGLFDLRNALHDDLHDTGQRGQ